MPEKITINNESWFDDASFKGKDSLSLSSDIELKQFWLFYPLPWLLELVFFSILVSAILALFTLTNIYPKDDLFFIYAATVPCYLMLRFGLIRYSYQLKKAPKVCISNERLDLSTNRVINKTKEQLIITKQDVIDIQIDYWVKSGDVDRASSRRSFSVKKVTFVLHSRAELVLKPIYFDLIPIVYLLTYFGYPISSNNTGVPVVPPVKILILVLPVLGHMVVTGLAFKEQIFDIFKIALQFLGFS